jgi:cation transport regulator
LPYVSVEDLPPPIRAHLPQHAEEIYLSAFNNAWAEYAARGPTQRARIAHRVAWAAAKREYQKAGDRWIPCDDSFGAALRFLRNRAQRVRDCG